MKYCIVCFRKHYKMPTYVILYTNNSNIKCFHLSSSLNSGFNTAILEYDIKLIKYTYSLLKLNLMYDSCYSEWAQNNKFKIQILED